MFTPRIRAALLVASASLGLSACTGLYGGPGVGVGLGYGNGYGAYGSPYYGAGYGYGSPYYGAGYGYGSPYYSGFGYGSPYYGGFGSGFGMPLSYYGWYNNYYYPGTGYYVYTRDGSRQRWSDAQRRYWESRRAQVKAEEVRENWTAYRQPNTTVRQRNVTRPARVVRSTSVEHQGSDRHATRVANREDRQTTRVANRTERQTTRGERRHRRNSTED